LEKKLKPHCSVRLFYLEPCRSVGKLTDSCYHCYYTRARVRARHMHKLNYSYQQSIFARVVQKIRRSIVLAIRVHNEDPGSLIRSNPESSKDHRHRAKPVPFRGNLFLPLGLVVWSPSSACPAATSFRPR